MTGQSYRNHARYVPLYHVGLYGLLAWNLVRRVMDLVRARSIPTLMDLVVAVALLLLTYYARAFALTVQDRLIRLEMRLRLRELLAPELLAGAARLTPPQLVALRFAGDAELPGLVAEVVEGRLQSGDQIKRRIQDWQPDTLRV